MLSWMILPTTRQKLPPRWREGKTSAWFGAVVQHSLRILAEKMIASENVVVTPTNATRTHACARHAFDPSLRGRHLAFDDCDWAIFSESPFRRYRIF
jgi:hypothetical protein